MSIIKQIYEGEFVLPAMVYPDEPEYLKLKEEYNGKLRQLSTLLNETETKLLDDILSLRIELDSIMEFENFLAGFKTGAKIIMESLKNE